MASKHFNAENEMRGKSELIEYNILLYLIKYIERNKIRHDLLIFNLRLISIQMFSLSVIQFYLK